jgi:hypothetical protein
MRVSVLKELRERFLRLFKDRKGISLISLGRDLRESDKDPELDKLITDIMVKLNNKGIPHDLVPAGFIVLQEDYEDAMKIIVNCVETAKGYRTVRFSRGSLSSE